MRAEALHRVCVRRQLSAGGNPVNGLGSPGVIRFGEHATSPDRGFIGAIDNVDLETWVNANKHLPERADWTAPSRLCVTP